MSGRTKRARRILSKEGPSKDDKSESFEQQLHLPPGIEFVRIEVDDIHGFSRGFTLDVDFFKKSLQTGVPYCISLNGVALNGVDFVQNTGVCGEIDWLNGSAYPDLKTIKTLPWRPNTASVLVDFRQKFGDSESPLVSCSTRGICKKQLNRLEEKGYRLYSAFEFEMYALDKTTKMPICNDISLCSTLLDSKHADISQNIMRTMKQLGLSIERCNAEYGPSQLEITYSPSYGIDAADAAFRFKHAAKECTKDSIITFLSKPFPDKSGVAGHFNHSLWTGEFSACPSEGHAEIPLVQSGTSSNEKNEKNAFYDVTRPYGLSNLAEHWLAGLQYHAKALTALCCPTTNCYQRLKPGCFTPVNNLWGLDNRTVGFRVKNLDHQNTYIENRIPGGMVNPYLATAATIIAGLDGIDQKMKLTTPPFKGDGSMSKELPSDSIVLPQTLEEALNALQQNDVFIRELGDEFIKCFCAVKRHDIDWMDKLLDKKRYECECRCARENLTKFI